MGETLRIAVVNAEADRLAELNERLGGCECAAASFDEDRPALRCTLGGPPDAVLVYGAHDAQRAARTCRRMRSAEGLQDVPLLLAITRYQMAAGHELRDVPKSHFILTPVEESTLRWRLEQISSAQA